MAVESVNLKTFSNNTYSLKTGNKCFLCLTKVYNSSNNSDSDKFDCLDSGSESIKTEKLDGDYALLAASKQQSEHSLWAIFRHLKLNSKQFLLQSLPISDLKNNEQLINQCQNFVVPLCGTCGSLVDQLTTLCTDLEVLHMKVNDKLHSFRTMLEENKTEHEETQQIHHLALEALRSKTKSVCDTGLKQVLPRVNISAIKSLTEAESFTEYFSEEPVVIKTECLDTIVSGSCQEALVSKPAPQTVIGTSQINPPIGLVNKTQCHQCQKWVSKKHISRHRSSKLCKATPQPNIAKSLKPVYIEQILYKGKTKCDICHKTVPSSSNLLRHIRKAHPSSGIMWPGTKRKDQIKCEKCDTVLQKANIARHLRKHCPGRKTIAKTVGAEEILPENSEKVRQPKVLKLYKYVHAGKILNEEKTQCDICHVTFPNSNCLLRHIRRSHPSSGIFGSTDQVKCEQCGKLLHKLGIWRHLKHHCPGHTEILTVDPLGEAELEKESLKRQGKLHETFVAPNIVKPKSVLSNVKVRCDQSGTMISKKNILYHKKCNCPFGPRLPGRNMKPTKCNVCGKLYRSVSNMCCHRKKKHPEYRSAMQCKMQSWQNSQSEK